MELIEEKIILKNLVTNDEYFSKVFPFLSEKVFTENYTKKLFRCIHEYNQRYNKRPTIPVISLFVEQVKGKTDKDYESLIKPNEERLSGSSYGSIGYTKKLTEHVIKTASERSTDRNSE